MSPSRSRPDGNCEHSGSRLRPRQENAEGLRLACGNGSSALPAPGAWSSNHPDDDIVPRRRQAGNRQVTQDQRGWFLARRVRSLWCVARADQAVRALQGGCESDCAG